MSEDDALAPLDQAVEAKARRRRELAELSAAYKERLDPSNPRGQAVWKDLAAFCCQQSTTHVPGDTHATAINEGRRQVFLRMAFFCNLNVSIPPHG